MSGKNYGKVREWDPIKCKRAKLQLAMALKFAKDNGFSQDYKKNVLCKKRIYCKLLVVKKKKYRSMTIKKIKNCNSSSLFWQTVRALRGSPPTQSDVDLPSWHRYLDNIYLNRIVNTQYAPLSRISYPILNSAITTDEILILLSHCKNGKAPDVDGIGFKFYKNLPHNWILLIHCFFNLILTSETVPDIWLGGKLATFMLSKRGSVDNPENYRPITLVNCIVKVFSQILCEQLTLWSSEVNLIPESQSEFRKGRSCLDNLFTLQSVI